MPDTSHSPLQEVVLQDGPPDPVEPSEIRAALESSRPLLRHRGVRVCARLAEDDVDRVRPFVGELGEALADENPGVVQTAAGVLHHVATADVEAVTEVVVDIAALADSEFGGIQLAGAELLSLLALERPAACAPVFDSLVDAMAAPGARGGDDSFATCIDDRETRETIRQHEREETEHREIARQRFANVLVAIAESQPSSAADSVEDVTSLLECDALHVRGAALDVLCEVGRANPEAVEPVADTVAEQLHSEEPMFRARAIQTLGFLGDDRYVDRLEQAAEMDEDEEIAAFAAETATFLAGE